MQAPFVYYTTGSTQLENAYLFPSAQMQFFATQSYSGSIDFGLFVEDVLEFSVYNSSPSSGSSSDLIYWNCVDANETTSSISRSYTDVNNQFQKYSYTTIVNSDITILNGLYQSSGGLPELILSPITDLINAGYGDGNYVVSYNLFRNTVGFSGNSVALYINNISPSKTEIQVLPQCLKTTTTDDGKKLLEQYYAFANEKPYVKYVVSYIMDNISNPPITNYYKQQAVLHQSTFINELKSAFSFQSDNAVINFLSGVYQTTAFQMEQYLFSRYDSPLGFEEIERAHTDLATAVLTTALKKIRLNSKTASIVNNFDQFISFMLSIFDQCLSIESVKHQYNEVFGKELKYIVNFGNNQLLPILNWALSTDNASDPVYNQPLLIKLASPLPDNVNIGDTFWISNQQFTSLYQSVYITTSTTIPVIQLAGPDFTKKISNATAPTKGYNYDELTNSGSVTYTDILNTLNNLSEFNNLNIDYSVVSNFVHFSSLQTRLSNYDYKLSQINQLTAMINSYSQSLNFDMYSATDQATLVNKQNSIIQSFDGYEKFLYTNPSYVAIHQASSSVYDRNNPDYLVNNTPDFITYNTDNGDYIQFLKMVGQLFDSIWLYINNFPTIQNADNRFSKLSQNIINNTLESFGWDVYSGTDNQDLSLNILGQDANGNIIQGAGSDRTFEISKRILNTLPYLLKTKGTEESIRALFKCYGIPNNIFDIKEYGGIEYSTGLSNDSLYIFDDVSYMLTIINPNEYIQTPWSTNVQSIEFKFSIDKSTVNPNTVNCLLMVNGSNWAIGIRRQGQNSELAQVYFTINDGYGNYQTVFSDMLPLYNGEIFSVLVRKNSVDGIYDLPVCSNYDLNEIPTAYDLKVEQYANNGFTFYSTSSITLTGSFNDSFINASSSTIIGNSPDYITTGSINYFVGSIDNIRYWSHPLSDDSFDHHVQFSDGYDLDDPSLIYDALLLRLDFDIPADLSVSASYQLTNGAFNTNLLSGSIIAKNFRSVSYNSSSYHIESTDCPPTTESVISTIPGQFPYQFTEFDIRETINLPNFGSNKFRNNKIKVVSQSLFAPLSYNSRATVSSTEADPADSNKLAITFSPIDQINLDILKFFGNFQLGDFIGDPGEQASSSYASFETFKQFYYNSGFQNIDYDHFINTFKSFIDPSLFGHIKNLVPARANLVTGLLIEPSILERSKVACRNPDLPTVNQFIAGICSKATTEAVNSLLPTTSLKVGTDAKFTGFDTGYLQKYFGEIDDGGFGIYADRDGVASITTQNTGAVSVKKFVKVEISDYKLNKYGYTGPDTAQQVTEIVNRLNLIPSSTYSSASALTAGGETMTGYYSKHYRFKRKLFDNIAVQDSSTTFDPTTLLSDGSSPIVTTTVDRGALVVTTQGGGNILSVN